MQALLTVSVSGLVLGAFATSGIAVVASHPGVAGVVVGLVTALIVDR